MGRIAIWLTVVLTVVPACRRPAGPDVIAEIGDRRIRYQEFSDYVAAAVGGRAEGLESQVLAALFDEFLDQAIAGELAAAEVPPGTPRDRAFEVWVDGLQVSAPSVSELRARFRRQRKTLPERVVLRQLVLATREEAQETRREIAEGTAFADIADRVNGGDAYQTAGGLQGPFAAGDLPREVADEVFSLQPRTVSRVVEMDHGFALFEVVRFLPPDEQSFEELRDELQRQFLAERRQQALEARIDAYRKPENVTIYPANLPFDYTGAYEDLVNEVS